MEKELLIHLEQWEKRITDKVSENVTEKIIHKIEAVKDAEIEFLKSEIDTLQEVISIIGNKKFLGIPLGMFFVHGAFENIKKKDNEHEQQKNN